MREIEKFIVFDIGGSSIKWSIVEKSGKILKSDKYPVEKNVQDFFEKLIEIIEISKNEYKVKGVAISAPGAVDSETGIIYGISAIEYIHGPNFKEIIKSKTGLNVEIENDANCAALGECWIGSGKQYNDIAFVICGTGIGGALIKDKKIHKGIHRHGGEFGYCIMEPIKDENENFKSWSETGSIGALIKEVATKKGIDEKEIDGLKIFEMAKSGDEICIKEVDKFYYYMAVGIYNIQYTYDSEIIILGGAISERYDYIDEINKRIDIIMNKRNSGELRPNIKKCEKGNDANKLGALYHYLQVNNKNLEE